MPGVQRTTGSVVYPGGGGPQIGIPAPIYPAFGGNLGRVAPGASFGQPGMTRGSGHHGGSSVIVPYPVYVGGGYGGYYDASYLAPGVQPLTLPAPQQQQQPNVMVIYPPQQGPVNITLIPNGDGQYTVSTGQPSAGLYQPAITPPPVQAPQAADQTAMPEEATHYLIAFKDHTIYSAVAYWVEGDTLHYFTSGNTHNQVSVALIDRDLTTRLNKESGLEVKLPAAR